MTPKNSQVLCHPVQPNAFLGCCCRLTVCSQQVKSGLLVNEMLSLSSTIFPKAILCPKNLQKEFGRQAKKRRIEAEKFHISVNFVQANRQYLHACM